MQRIRLLHLLELRQSRQHILNRIQTIPALIPRLACEIRVALDELLKIGHELLNHIFHMSVPILQPYLILLRDGDVFDLLVRLAFVDGDAVGYLVVFLDGEEVVGHGLVGEVVDEGREEVDATVEDVEAASGSCGGWREVVVELGVEVKFVLDEAGEVGAEDAGLVGWSAGAVVADCWVLAEGYANSHYLGAI
jgi:hypothetical protein